MSEPDQSPNVGGLTAEEANRIIHSHRKVRYGTACWPCRQRKVKCDTRGPDRSCENCIRREHPQLCSYKPNRSVPSKDTPGTSEPIVSRSKRSYSSDDERRPGSAKRQDGELRTYVDSDSAEGTRYLGQNSIPALLREQSSPNEPQENTIRHDMRSILGLDYSAPFPLMSSQHLDRLTVDIQSELPSDREVMKLFRTYKEIPQHFWGFVIDIDELESRLMLYLEDRAKNAKASIRATKPVSASWLALLFGVLAVGSQYHDSPYHTRTRDSQNYIQIAWHFLRLSNFLMRPNFDSMQALLMVSFGLLNDMKAEAAWALLGFTCRLGQSLGLHRANSVDGHASPAVQKKEFARRKLWWTNAWHDTLISLSFDRFPMTNMPCCPIPLSPLAETEGWAYLEAMYHLCQLISRRLNPDALASATYAEILDNCEAVEAILGKMLPQLRSREACRTVIDRLQHFAIRLHTSFVVSVCCRPALRRVDNDRLTPSEKRYLAERCKDKLTETVRMFLAMHQLSVIPTRSWAFTYHGLSSAVLLGILCETKADPEIRQLQGDLIAALSATAAMEQWVSPSVNSHISKTDRDIELSGPLSRALAALKNIYNHGTVAGSSGRKESSGSRTPLAGAQHTNFAKNGSAPVDSTAVAVSMSSNSESELDPHRNAALAMAELQQQQQQQQPPPTQQHVGVGGAPDFTSAMPYVAAPYPPTQVPIVDLSSIDPSTYTSPMDVLDFIFQESPDPWNMATDTMQLDFNAQPPPGQPPQQQFYF